MPANSRAPTLLLRRKVTECCRKRRWLGQGAECRDWIGTGFLPGPTTTLAVSPGFQRLRQGPSLLLYCGEYLLSFFQFSLEGMAVTRFPKEGRQTV